MRSPKSSESDNYNASLRTTEEDGAGQIITLELELQVDVIG